MYALDTVIAIITVPSALIVLLWSYLILKKAVRGEVSFRAVIALGLGVAAAKSIAMAIGTSGPPPSWALALAMLCMAAWILRLVSKYHGGIAPGPTGWDQLI